MRGAPEAHPGESAGEAPPPSASREPPTRLAAGGGRPARFYAGIAAVALVTLSLELANTRLLSVLTWYHLAFLAISLSLLGLTAGALVAYLSPGRFAPGAVAGRLVQFSLLTALSIPASHLALLVLRIPTELGGDAMAVLSLLLVGTVAAVPFFFAGVVIAVGLTRVDLPLGRIYGADLLGAGLGCLLAVPLLDHLDPTSAVFLLGAVAAGAGWAFAAWGGAGAAGPPSARRSPALGPALLGAGLLLLAGVNHALYPGLFRIEVMKGRSLPRPLAIDRWNSHSRITAPAARVGRPALWGASSVPAGVRVRQVPLRIDGGAFTVATAFDGDAARLGWLRQDVTSLAHHLRPAAEVAVIGVGGGRDLITALAFGSRHATGIEVNRLFLDLLAGELRSLTGLSGRPDLTLVHAEGRSFLAAHEGRYDLIQMALVDTWASTSAGAMTLTENGLYTVEAWRLFLSRLAPEGVLSVSRWYAPDRPGETARLLSLAVAALLAEGAAAPQQHLALASAGRLATLIVGRERLPGAGVGRLERAVRRHGFTFLLRPDAVPADPVLAPIAAARSERELAEAVAHPHFDLAPPTDDRPFFFNMAKPAAWLAGAELRRQAAGGVMEGNLRATDTLMAILLAVTLLVLASLVAPLAVRGRGHGLGAGEFAVAAGYFSLIGLGFMVVEIALIQRFSLLLGHPIYSLSVTLMSLIVAAGVGSLVSDRIALASRRTALAVPLGVAALVAVAVPALGAASGWATSTPLAVRAGLVVLFTAPVGFALGLPFPLGMRLLRRRSATVLSWMWGLNGAFGVLGSVVAVLVSLTAGIGWCLGLGAACYLALLLPAGLLWSGARMEAR